MSAWWRGFIRKQVFVIDVFKEYFLLQVLTFLTGNVKLGPNVDREAPVSAPGIHRDQPPLSLLSINAQDL